MKLTTASAFLYKYNAKRSYELIDADLHAVISEYELEDYRQKLKEIVNSVSDIVEIKVLGCKC